MKKIAFLIVVILFTMLSINQTKAFCPTWGGPWVEQIVTIEFEGCTYSCHVCVVCNTQATQPHLDYYIEGIFTNTPMGSPCYVKLITKNDEIIARLKELLSSYAFILALCDNAIPPCLPKPLTVTISQPVCWKKVATNVYTASLLPCSNDRYCKETFTLCWDPFLNKLTKSVSFYEEFGAGAISCPDLISVPDPNPPTTWESDCFHLLSSPCPY